MKKSNRSFLALILAGAFSLGALAACGGPTHPTPNPEDPDEDDPEDEDVTFLDATGTTVQLVSGLEGVGVNVRLL